MDRRGWLAEKRRLAEERMDAHFAPVYDQHWGSSINPTHRRMLERFLGLCPPRGIVLDAACGTGKYWPLILDRGRSVVGVDQSGEMLRRAGSKFPDVPTEKVGLQELRYGRAFDGVICVDAMENVFPEDWPPVLRNFRGALKGLGPLYLTVELLDGGELREAFETGRRMGLPVVEGEHAHEGGYHYYPPMESVRSWLRDAGFAVLEEAEGDGYRHILARGARTEPRRTHHGRWSTFR